MKLKSLAVAPTKVVTATLLGPTVTVTEKIATNRKGFLLVSYIRRVFALNKKKREKSSLPLQHWLVKKGHGRALRKTVQQFFSKLAIYLGSCESTRDNDNITAMLLKGVSS